MKALTMALFLMGGAAAQGQGERPDLVEMLSLPVEYAKVFGLRLAFYEAGPPDSPAVILIPGIGWEARHAWAHNVTEIAGKYRVIAIDPLGLGRSDKPLIDYKMGTWTDGLAEFMRVKKIARAVFGGPTMGGALAIQMALDHPDLVRGIVVTATEEGPAALRQTGPRSAFVPTLAATRTGLLRSFFDPTLVTDQLVRLRYEYLIGSGIGYTLQRHLADHRPPYSTEELSQVLVPALVIWCREDRLTPLNQGEILARALPEGRLAVLDRCGHLPNMERPQAFNKALGEFLDSLK